MPSLQPRFDRQKKAKLNILSKVTEVFQTYPIYFFVLDFVKDITFLCLFSNSFRNLEKQCEAPSSDLCFQASPAEYGLFYSMIGFIALSNFTTGIYCFTHKEKIYQHKYSNYLLKTVFNVTLLLFFLLLPLFIQISLANIKHQLSEIEEELRFGRNLARNFAKQTLFRK